MLRRRFLSLPIVFLGLLYGGTNANDPVEKATIAAGDLKVVFRDNTESPRTLSGLASLFNTKSAPDFDAFDPDTQGASAGLNFEHIISGQRNPNNKFTPRSGAYRIYHDADEKSVTLVRRAEDSPWKIASTLRYTVVPPHHVDFEFRCQPRDASLFGKHNYAIFFFANYMNDVIDPALHFLGIPDETTEKEVWVSGDAPRGPREWVGGGTYRGIDAKPLKMDDAVEFRLNTWSYDWPRISQPFYYGLAEEDMTLILMFDRLSSARDQIRFSLFKFKLNQFPRPAWDFQYVINDVKQDENYGFRGRLVWKKFVSPEDCQQEYEQWSQQLQQSSVQQLRQLGATVFEEGQVVKEVNANGTRISNDQMQWLGTFREMTDLSLERTHINDQGIARLTRLPKLEWLNLYQCPVGDETLEHLQKFKQLQHLPIGESRVTDAGLKYLKHHTQLQYLGLRGNQITDEGLRELSSLTKLKGLHLGQTKISEAGLKHLKSLSKLERLWLDDTDIGDAGVDDLVGFTRLKELHVGNTNISEEGFQKLQQSLPRCRLFVAD